jgi:UDP-N-acetylglucosamine acyltransferase
MTFHPSNEIHETTVISGDVVLGRNNRIGPYCVLEGPLTIGDDNWIGPHAVIGTPGQDTRNPRYDSSDRPIAIGDRNIIREFTAIQKPAYREITRLGSDIFLMQAVHIPHDAHIEDKVVITPTVVLAGVTRIMVGANLGLGATIHQYGVVGPYTMVAMGATVVKNIKPFAKLVPGRSTTVNSYAVKKFGFDEYADEITAYVMEGVPPVSGPVRELVDRYEELHRASGRGQYA